MGTIFLKLFCAVSWAAQVAAEIDIVAAAAALNDAKVVEKAMQVTTMKAMT